MILCETSTAAGLFGSDQRVAVDVTNLQQVPAQVVGLHFSDVHPLLRSDAQTDEGRVGHVLEASDDKLLHSEHFTGPTQAFT